MLEGINILNQTEIMRDPEWFGWVAAIGFFVLFVGIGVLVTILSHSDGTGVCIGLIVAVVYAAILFGIWGQSVPTGRYQYEAKIDESVNFIELYEWYDVVEQRGEIYILEDKEK